MVLHSCLILLIIVIPLGDSAVPPNFFWKPRVGLHIPLPTSNVETKKVNKPTMQNMAQGFVVLIDGYQAGISVMTFIHNIRNNETFSHLSPLSGYFFTNVYRWSLRHLSLIPHWLGSSSGNYYDTHKTWRKRFHYTDHFVPNWMRKLLLHINEAEWKQEEWEYKRYKKYAEPAFAKYCRYPSKQFRNFQSDRIDPTVEGMDSQLSL